MAQVPRLTTLATFAAPSDMRCAFALPANVQPDVDHARAYFRIKKPAKFWLCSLEDFGADEETLAWALPFSGITELDPERGIRLTCLLAGMGYCQLLEQLRPSAERWFADFDWQNDDNDTPFRQACAHDALDAAKWFVSVFGAAMIDIGSDGTRVAFKHGHMRVAQWLADTFDRATMFNNYMRSQCLRYAAKNGRLDMAQWLCSITNVTRAHIGTQWYESALVHACQGNSLEFVQWMVMTFGLTNADARYQGHGEMRNVLFYPCWGGNLPMAQYIAAQFNITAPEVYSGGHAALNLARDNGHDHVVAWLTANYYLDGAPNN